MENNLHQAPANPEVICSTLRAVPEETHLWFPDLEALFSDPRSRLIDSLVKNDLYVLLKKKGIEVQSTSVNGHGMHEGERIWELKNQRRYMRSGRVCLSSELPGAALASSTGQISDPRYFAD